MKLTHPDTRRTIEVSPEQAPLYQQQGWRPVKAPATKAPAKKASPRKG